MDQVQLRGAGWEVPGAASLRPACRRHLESQWLAVVCLPDARGAEVWRAAVCHEGLCSEVPCARPLYAASCEQVRLD